MIFSTHLKIFFVSLSVSHDFKNPQMSPKQFFDVVSYGDWGLKNIPETSRV